MVDRVADELDDRREDLLGDGLVELRTREIEIEVHRLARGRPQPSHHQRERLEHLGHMHHPELQDRLTKVAYPAAVLVHRVPEITNVDAVGGERLDGTLDPMTRDDDRAELRQRPLEAVDAHADDPAPPAAAGVRADRGDHGRVHAPGQGAEPLARSHHDRIGSRSMWGQTPIEAGHEQPRRQRVEVHAGGGRVRVVLERVDGDACVSVHDTGRGIAPEALPRVFDRYSRAIDDEHEVVGSGLGLMIVKQTVEAHGGRVGVRSEEGEGSTCWFRIPLAASRAA